MNEFRDLLPLGPRWQRALRARGWGLVGLLLAPGAVKQGPMAVGLGFKAHCCEPWLELGEHGGGSSGRHQGVGAAEAPGVPGAGANPELCLEPHFVAMGWLGC